MIYSVPLGWLKAQSFSRPRGTRRFLFNPSPAMNCRAVLSRPYGTGNVVIPIAGLFSFVLWDRALATLFVTFSSAQVLRLEEVWRRVQYTAAASVAIIGAIGYGLFKLFED